MEVFEILHPQHGTGIKGGNGGEGGSGEHASMMLVSPPKKNCACSVGFEFCSGFPLFKVKLNSLVD